MVVRKATDCTYNVHSVHIGSSMHAHHDDEMAIHLIIAKYSRTTTHASIKSLINK